MAGKLTPVNFSELDRNVAGMILGREQAVMVSYVDYSYDGNPRFGNGQRTFLVPLKEVVKGSSLRKVIKWHKEKAVVSYAYYVDDHESDDASDRILERLIMEMGLDPWNISEKQKDWAVPAWNLVKYELTTDLAAFGGLVPTRWLTVEHYRMRK